MPASTLAALAVELDRGDDSLWDSDPRTIICNLGIDRHLMSPFTDEEAVEWLQQGIRAARAIDDAEERAEYSARRIRELKGRMRNKYSSQRQDLAALQAQYNLGHATTTSEQRGEQLTEEKDASQKPSEYAGNTPSIPRASWLWQWTRTWTGLWIGLLIFTCLLFVCALWRRKPTTEACWHGMRGAWWLLRRKFERALGSDEEGAPRDNVNEGVGGGRELTQEDWQANKDWLEDMEKTKLRK